MVFGSVKIMKRLICFFTAFVLVFSICACADKKHIASNTSQDNYVDQLCSTVRSWANAYYQNDAEGYLHYSFKNPDCMQALGNSEYDFESIKASTIQELDSYKSYMNENYSFYYVEAEPSNYEIYDKSSEIYSDYLAELSKMYSSADVVDVFALVEFQIRMDYKEGEGSLLQKQETANAECMLIDGVWYVIN